MDNIINNKLLQVDKYVREFINQEEKDIYLDNLDMFIEASKKVALMKEYTYESPDWSRRVDINDSIEYVFRFLNSIYPELGERYSNLISYVDKNRKPIVSIKSRRLYKNEEIYSNNVDEHGKVHIFYVGDPSDMFNILHEMLHKMNQADIILEDGREIESTSREVYGETASILGEFLLGDWAVKQGIITQNDFDKIISKRVAITKENASSVLVQTKLIMMVLKSQEINLENLKNELENEQDDLLRSIYEKEECLFANINDVLMSQEVTLPRFQRYVTALYNVAEAMNKDNRVEIFISLQDELSNPESDINYVTDKIYKKIHSK